MKVNNYISNDLNWLFDHQFNKFYDLKNSIENFDLKNNSIDDFEKHLRVYTHNYEYSFKNYEFFLTKDWKDLKETVENILNDMYKNNKKIINEYIKTKKNNKLKLISENWEINLDLFNLFLNISKWINSNNQNIKIEIWWKKISLNELSYDKIINEEEMELITKIIENEYIHIKKLKEFNNYKRNSKMSKKNENWEIMNHFIQLPTHLWIRTSFLFNVLFKISDIYYDVADISFYYIHFLSWVYWVNEFFDDIDNKIYINKVKNRISKKIKWKKARSWLLWVYNSMRNARDRNVITSIFNKPEELNLFMQFYILFSWIITIISEKKWLINNKIYKEMMKWYVNMKRMFNYNFSYNTIKKNLNINFFIKNAELKQNNKLIHIENILNFIWINKTEEWIIIEPKEAQILSWFLKLKSQSEDDIENEILSTTLTEEILNEYLWYLNNHIYKFIIDLYKNNHKEYKKDLMKTIKIIQQMDKNFSIEEEELNLIISKKEESEENKNYEDNE